VPLLDCLRSKNRLLHYRLPPDIVSRIDHLFLLRLHEWQTTILLLEPHCSKTDHDHNPVQVVRKHRTIRRRICPAKQGVEDTPTTASIDLRRAAVDMPDTLADVVGSWPGACLAGVASDDVVPSVVLEEPDRA